VWGRGCQRCCHLSHGHREATKKGSCSNSPQPSTTGTETGDRHDLTAAWSTDRSSVADNLFMSLGQVLD
jgi:hypothetical protein